MQVVNAFTSVQSLLPFILSSYTNIAALAGGDGAIDRLRRRLSAIHHAAREAGKFVIRHSEIGIAVHRVDLDLPDGTPLLRGVAFASGVVKRY
jgi:hypothetical protein